MPYIVTGQVRRTHQLTLDEVLAGTADALPDLAFDPTGTVTRFLEQAPQKYAEHFDAFGMVEKLKQFSIRWSHLYNTDRKSLYNTFHIPKKTGGLRRIDAPCDQLMTALRDLKDILENNCGPMYHTSAFAYVPERSTINAVRKHQANVSKWFLKTDFSDFFGSTTPEFLMSMVERIFPFSEIVEIPDGREALEKAFDLCFLNGGLPQGTPISPMLTNLMMIPIDHKLASMLWSKGYVYTRYADDIIISHKRYFMFVPIVDSIREVIREFNAPFTIKREKTRYGSSSGSNWNLGVMLNKDNQITFGHKNKMQLKAMCTNFVRDWRNKVAWDPHDVNVLSGLISYYTMVEPDYMRDFIQYINRRLGVNFMALLRHVQRGDC